MAMSEYMKRARLFGVILLLALALSGIVLSGCSGESQKSQQSAASQSAQSSSSSTSQFSGKPLAQVADDEQRAVLEGSGAEPVAAGITRYGVDGEHESITYGADAVKEMRDYLNGVVVGDESDIMATDADSYYVFYFADGSEVSFHFMLDEICLDGNYYETSDTVKLSREFVGEDTMLVLDPPTQEIAAFVDRLQSDEPTSASIEDSNGVATMQDAALESLVGDFENLYLHGGINSRNFAEHIDYRDLQPTVYTFTWSDGSTDTLEFKGNYLCVTYPDELGTWGFYVEKLPGKDAS